VEGFSPDALAALRAHAWPGNVRELENAVERAAALAEGPLIGLDDLPEAVRGGGAAAEPALALPEAVTLAEAERILVRHALDATGGNKKEAARRLGIGLATLYRKLAAEEDAAATDGDSA